MASKEMIRLNTYTQPRHVIYKKFLNIENHYVDERSLEKVKAPFLINMQNNEQLLPFIEGMHDCGKFKKYITKRLFQYKNTKCKLSVIGFVLKESLFSLLAQKDYSQLDCFREHRDNIEQYFLYSDPFKRDRFNDIIIGEDYNVTLKDSNNEPVQKVISTIKVNGSIRLSMDGVIYDRLWYNNIKAFKLFRKVGSIEINHYDKFLPLLEDYYAKVSCQQKTDNWQDYIEKETQRLLSIDLKTLEESLKSGVK